MQFTKIFPTIFGQTRPGLDTNNLTKIAYLFEEQFSGDTRDGGYQSPFFDLEQPGIKELVNVVNEQANELAKRIYQLKPGSTLSVTNGWVNINRPGHNQLHNNYYHLHPGYFASFVYYVQTKQNSGNLVLMPPFNMLDYVIDDNIMQTNAYNHTRWHITPEVDKMICFPAWVHHFVEANLSDIDRISYAFNVSIKTIISEV